MRRDNDIVELLNDVLTAELTSVNQYFVDSKMLANWGYERLAEKFRDESISEMKDADELIGRILFLEGVPNLQRLGTLRVGEDVAEKLAGRARRSSTNRSSGSTTASRRASPPVTTAPVSCSTTSSRAKRSSPTGSRRNRS